MKTQAIKGTDLLFSSAEADSPMNEGATGFKSMRTFADMPGGYLAVNRKKQPNTAATDSIFLCTIS